MYPGPVGDLAPDLEGIVAGRQTRVALGATAGRMPILLQPLEADLQAEVILVADAQGGELSLEGVVPVGNFQRPGGCCIKRIGAKGEGIGFQRRWRRGASIGLGIEACDATHGPDPHVAIGVREEGHVVGAVADEPVAVGEQLHCSGGTHPMHPGPGAGPEVPPGIFSHEEKGAGWIDLRVEVPQEAQLTMFVAGPGHPQVCIVAQEQVTVAKCARIGHGILAQAIGAGEAAPAPPFAKSQAMIARGPQPPGTILVEVHDGLLGSAPRQGLGCEGPVTALAASLQEAPRVRRHPEGAGPVEEQTEDTAIGPDALFRTKSHGATRRRIPPPDPWGARKVEGPIRSPDLGADLCVFRTRDHLPSLWPQPSQPLFRPCEQGPISIAPEAPA